MSLVSVVGPKAIFDATVSRMPMDSLAVARGQAHPNISPWRFFCVLPVRAVADPNP